MKSRIRRLKAIELSLTPQQVVLVWLRDALQGGTFEDGARHSPPYRGAVANAVFRTVTESMKGQPEPLVERAILQARQEADLLYLLVVKANSAAIEGMVQREREYVFLLGYLSAEMHGNLTKDRLGILRRVVLMFITPVILLDAAIAQIVAERLNGQPVLFRDCSVQLEEQLQMVERVSEVFNCLARSVSTAEISLEELRKSLQSEIDQQITIWVKLARVTMLSLFGQHEEVQAAVDQCFASLEMKSGEGATPSV
jgi:hypothetical protein